MLYRTNLNNQSFIPYPFVMKKSPTCIYKKNKKEKGRSNISILKQTLNNKKIYFNSEWTEIKIGYDENTSIWFVEIISE